MATTTNVKIDFAGLAASAYRVHCQVAGIKPSELPFADLDPVIQAQFEAVARHVANLLNYDHEEDGNINWQAFEAAYHPSWKPPRLRN